MVVGEFDPTQIVVSVLASCQYWVAGETPAVAAAAVAWTVAVFAAALAVASVVVGLDLPCRMTVAVVAAVADQVQSR